jgi:UDP-2,3-diacylglucosamine pyrophosphatase LpxH
MSLFPTANERLSQVFSEAPVVEFDSLDKFVIFSDSHRGDGSWKDDYAHNRNLHLHALSYYLARGHTYIELGDSDELFENRDFDDIRYAHSSVFRKMKEFYDDGRLLMINGNHDIERRDPKVVERQLFRFYNAYLDEYEDLFPNIQVHEGLVLKHKLTGQKLFFVHGHQGDWFNDLLWRPALFFVRNVWAPLQFLGWKDPTMPPDPFKKSGEVEQRISDWIDANQQMVVCGHTHRSRFPKSDETPYFNTGSCVHPRSITGIEIQDDTIALMKWELKSKLDESSADGLLTIVREVLADGPLPLQTIKYAR